MKTKDDRRRMLILLNHAGNLQGGADINYDINKQIIKIKKKLNQMI